MTQTPEIHEQIAELIAGLRDVRDTPRKVIDAGGRLGPLRGPAQAFSVTCRNESIFNFKKLR